MKAFIIAVAAAVLGSILSIAVVGHAQAAKTPSAVAYISSNRILSESNHGRAEAGRIQTMQQQRATDLRSKQQAIDATRQQLATASDGATRVALQQKELQQRSELERATQQAQADIQALQREVTTDLQQRVKVVLDEIMKTQNYQMVVNAESSVIWSAPELDLSSAVIGRLNGQ